MIYGQKPANLPRTKGRKIGVITIRNRDEILWHLSSYVTTRHLTLQGVYGRVSKPESDFVFTNAEGGRIGWLQHGFRKALARAGLSDLHFHDLRHTFASQWMMAGGDVYVLKAILGHKSIAMTQRYAHLSPEYKKAMVERMEQIWTKPSTKPLDRTLPSRSAHPTHHHGRVTKTALAATA